MAKRLIRIKYSGKSAAGGNGVGHASSFEGALRAAILRLFTGQYLTAYVYDLRFGGTTDHAPAMKIVAHGPSITVEWNPKKVNRK